MEKLFDFLCDTCDRKFEAMAGPRTKVTCPSSACSGVGMKQLGGKPGRGSRAAAPPQHTCHNEIVGIADISINMPNGEHLIGKAGVVRHVHREAAKTPRGGDA